MALFAESYPIVNIEARFWIGQKSFYMVRVYISAPLLATLASEMVSLKNRYAPKPIFRAVSNRLTLILLVVFRVLIAYHFFEHFQCCRQFRAFSPVNLRRKGKKKQANVLRAVFPYLPEKIFMYTD
jgi:hypothetical protein